MELREGNQADKASASSGGSVIFEMTTEMILDYISLCTDGIEAQDDDVEFNLCITDTNENFYVMRRNGVLLYYEGMINEEASTTITCTRMQLIGYIMQADVPALVIEGDETVLDKLIAHMKERNKYFNIIEP